MFLTSYFNSVQFHDFISRNKVLKNKYTRAHRKKTLTTDKNVTSKLTAANIHKQAGVA